MSYSRILRRINRILKSEAQGIIDSLSGKDADELRRFDEELKKSTAEDEHTADPKGTGARGAGTPGARAQRPGSQQGGSQQGGARGTTGGNRQQTSGQQRGPAGQGKRKPGEKDDAWYCAVLGLRSDASIEEIRKAHRALMRRYHPDRVATADAEAQRAASEKAKAINEAYHILARRRSFK